MKYVKVLILDVERGLLRLNRSGINLHAAETIFSSLFSLPELILNSDLIMKPPASFLQAMEEYVRDAPRFSSVRKDQVWKCSVLILILDIEEMLEPYFLSQNGPVKGHVVSLSIMNFQKKILRASLMDASILFYYAFLTKSTYVKLSYQFSNKT